MDQKKTILYVALAAILFLLWNAWQADYAPKSVGSAKQTKSITTSRTHQEGLSNQQQGLPPASVLASQGKPNVARRTASASSGSIITVKTDVLDVQINTRGGNIVKLGLLKYPASYQTPRTPQVTLSNDSLTFYVAQSGLVGKQGPDNKGQAQFGAAKKSYRLTDGQDKLVVPLTWQKNGVTVTKVFTFLRDKYQVGVHYVIRNDSQQTWQGDFYAQLRRKEPPKIGGMFTFHTYDGPAISSPQKSYEKLKYKKLAQENLNRDIKGGWLAMQQRYFVTAWVPNPKQTNHFYSSVDGDIYTLGFVSPAIQVSPGGTKTVGAKFYSGPELKERLQAVAKNLDLTIDFGFLWVIAVAILWLMEKINLFVGNWGWSIVIVTLIIKIIFYKFSESSYRSMAKMRQLSPRLKIIKERYSDDKQKLSQATMELYKKEKVNPLGGCLPMLIQIPFFFAWYYVLLEAVQLRQAPFLFWIHDLSTKDPYYILPVLMGISMWVQQKLNPEPPDPTQAKMMMLLPVIFTVFFLAFPAGLVLYWLTNNVVSVLQQWWIMRRLENEEKRKKAKR